MRSGEEGFLQVAALMLLVLLCCGTPSERGQECLPKRGCEVFERCYWYQLGHGSVLLKAGGRTVEAQEHVAGALGPLGVWHVSWSRNDLLSAVLFVDRDTRELVLGEIERCGGVKGTIVERIARDADGTILKRVTSVQWSVQSKYGGAASVSFSDDGRDVLDFERAGGVDLKSSSLRISWVDSTK